MGEGGSKPPPWHYLPLHVVVEATIVETWLRVRDIMVRVMNEISCRTYCTLVTLWLLRVAVHKGFLSLLSPVSTEVSLCLYFR